MKIRYKEGHNTKIAEVESDAVPRPGELVIGSNFRQVVDRVEWHLEVDRGEYVAQSATVWLKR